MEENKNKKNNPNVLADRLLDFAAEVIELTGLLPGFSVGKYITGQLVRSGTSPGANYEEACGAESRADFIHKMGIVLKELKESRFWLKLIKRTKLIKINKVEPTLKECEELCSIVAQSIITARGNK